MTYYYYSNMTDEQRVEKIREEVARAEARWTRSRERLAEFVEKEYSADSRIIEELMYADADLKVWRNIEYYLELPHPSGEPEPTVEEKVARVRKIVRREVQGYGGSRSSSQITNMIRDIEHLTWLEAAEMLDPSW